MANQWGQKCKKPWQDQGFTAERTGFEQLQQYQGNKPFAPKGRAESGAVDERPAPEAAGAHSQREHTKQLAVERLEALQNALDALCAACPTPGDLEAVADALTHLAAIKDLLSRFSG